jgi:hypothetical protein
VNKDTFSKWCDEFLTKLKEQEELSKTEQDLRKTGKELFMEKQGLADIDDLNIEDEEDVVLTNKAVEESKEADEEDEQQMEDDEGVALYDKELFA